MKVFFVSLGCDKNLVDSEIMLGILKEAGHEITFVEEEADVGIINTCGFISDATNEGVQTILKLSEYKKTGNLKTLVVAGCMAARYREQIFTELPEVDAVVSPRDFEEIANVLKNSSEGEKIVLMSDSKEIDEDKFLMRIPATPQHFAYLKIAEGCDNCCTYCTIPSIRGKYRSRSFDSLIKEAEILVGKGVKELILVAQDTSLYGTDFENAPQLPELMRRLSQIEDLKWIRVMYCYPEHLTDSIIEEMATNPKVCHYLDMPVQHGSDSVLKRMGRRSSSANILHTVKKLRDKMPDIVIRTSIIVGFPGETTEEFEELKSFIQEVKFDRLGVFSYSKEDGTPAFKMKNHLRKPEKEKRRKEIMNMQMDISAEKGKNFIGKVIEVLVDGRLPEDDVYIGRSYRDAYDVDGMVFFECEWELMTGEFVTVRIDESSEYDLTGVAVYEFTE